MSAAIAPYLGIVAYLALFTGVGLLFIFANLLVGRFLRPSDPHEEKLEVYECGEPTIGSSFVQFDLRFYVVALVFIIFDVEVAFFFPVAAVFGKTNHLRDDRLAVVASQTELTSDAHGLYREMGVRDPVVPARVPATLQRVYRAAFGGEAVVIESPAGSEFVIRQGARQYLLFTVVAIGIFFVVLMVGFAHEWKRGNLDWVRAIGRSPSVQERAVLDEGRREQPVISA